MRSDTLTASRMSTLLTCPRKHYWRYEVGLLPSKASGALRFGSAWHVAMECRWNGTPFDAALQMATAGAESFEAIDAATLAGMLAGYYARYAGESECVNTLYPEQEFCYALDGSRTFDVCGKIDGLGVLKDGRLVLVEHKTTCDSVGADSDYWLRLRFNPQIYQYVLAARALGWNVQTVIYDVMRKPSIRQKQNETAEAFGERLAEDTQKRPEFYFARREVPVLDQDVEEFRVQRLELSRMILRLRAASRRALKPEHAWPRNCGGMTCRFCEFEGFCMQNISVDPSNPPVGFSAGPTNPELSL